MKLVSFLERFHHGTTEPDSVSFWGAFEASPIRAHRFPVPQTSHLIASWSSFRDPDMLVCWNAEHNQNGDSYWVSFRFFVLRIEDRNLQKKHTICDFLLDYYQLWKIPPRYICTESITAEFAVFNKSSGDVSGLGPLASWGLWASKGSDTMDEGIAGSLRGEGWWNPRHEVSYIGPPY